jgi:hypothetical protein
MKSGEREGGEAVAAPLASLPARLPVPTVLRLHRVLEGDVQVEAMILRFIAEQYGAKDLLHLPAKVAEAALKRPADFIRAAKNHCEPELEL